MRIVDTPEKNLSYVEGKSDTKKVRKNSVNSSSTFFYVQYMQCIIEFIVLK